MFIEDTKCDQFFVNPERPEPGITAVSASFLAGLASQEVNRLEAEVKSSVFYDTFLELLTGSDQPRLIAKGKDEAFLKELLPIAERIGALRGFMAYVHEAVIEKQRRVEYLDRFDFEDWLRLPENSEKRAVRESLHEPKEPREPMSPIDATLDWAKSRLSVKDLAHYLLLEAKASTLGVYIHPEGVLANAKDNLADHVARPVEASVDGSNTTIRTFKPSAEPGLVYESYNRWQQAQRSWEAEVNTLKAKLDILIKNENLERTRRYREALNEYEKALKNYKAEVDRIGVEERKLQTEYRDWLVFQHEAVRQLKIVIPHELQSVYDYLASLGK